MQDSHREHAEILHAMARGDGDEAAYAMRGHMLNACGVLLRLLEEQRAEA
jgi:DNA-binding GntR family transcriptional regulator